MQIVLTVRAFKKTTEQRWLVVVSCETGCVQVNVTGSDVCSPAHRPDKHRLFPSVLVLSSYLLVVLHIVAQTDQTGLELLGHQGPTVVLRSAKHPMTGRHVMRMNQLQHRDGDGRRRSAACMEKMRTRRCGDTDRLADRQTDIHGCLDRCQHSQHDWAVKTWHTSTTVHVFNTCRCLWEATHPAFSQVPVESYIKNSSCKH